MPFVAKKILSALLMPSGILCLLLLFTAVLLLLRHRLAKASFAFTLLLTLLLMATSSYYPFLKQWEGRYAPLPALPVNHAVVVLGAAYQYHPDMPATAMLTAEAQARLIEGYRLWRSAPESQILTTGYAGRHQPDAPSYAQQAKAFLILLGVPEANITAIDWPRDTASEAKAIVQLTDKFSGWALVTSAYHMPRAMALMQGQGMQPIAAPTAFMALRQPAWWQLPSASNLKRWDVLMHEWIGMTWARLRGQVGP